MPFGAIGILLIVLLILAAAFGLLAYATGVIGAMAIFFALACVFMILIILIQRPKGGGLAGAFGGVGGGQQSVFGAKVGDVLTWVTVGFFVAFLALAMGLTWKIKEQQDSLLIPPQISGQQTTQTSGGDLPDPAIPVTGADDAEPGASSSASGPEADDSLPDSE